MKTSIILLNWNTLEFLKKCVESIKKFTNDMEIVIVDNGSTEEGTKKYIESVADKFIFNETNLGFSKGNNRGAKIADGKLFCFMNSDCVVGANWLEELKKVLFEHKKCGAVGPLGNPKSAKVNNIEYQFNQHIGQFSEDTRISTLVGFCILMKKKTFDKIGGWNEDFELGMFEDNYLNFQLEGEGYERWIAVKSDVKHLNPGRSFEANNLTYEEYLNKNRIKLDKKMENG